MPVLVARGLVGRNEDTATPVPAPNAQDVELAAHSKYYGRHVTTYTVTPLTVLTNEKL